MEDPAFLAPLVRSEPVFLVSDASQIAVAAVLYQAHSGRPRIVSVYSRTLTETESRWPVFDIEALALVEGLRRWELKLRDLRIIALSDHKGLSALFRPNPRLRDRSRRWVEVLLRFDISLKHVPGAAPVMALSDYLSRSDITSVSENAELLASSEQLRSALALEVQPSRPCTATRLATLSGEGRALHWHRWRNRITGRRLRKRVSSTLGPRMED